MIKSASQYHRHTSYQRDKMTPHYLDWQNQPGVFKDYPGITPLSLPSDLSLPEEELSSLLKGEEPRDKVEELDVGDLSLIFRLAYTLTAKARSAGGDFYFRSVASAGALYPTELYVAAHSVAGLDDGLYHFAIHRHCLYPIRAHGISRHIASFIKMPDSRVPLITFFLTAIFFRSAWKYRDRSYRYHLMDTGHLVENLVLALKALRLPVNLSYEFDDGKVNRLLGLDETKEVCLAVVQVSGKGVADSTAEEIAEVPKRLTEASQVAGKEIDYPAVREFHQAGASPMPEARPSSIMLHEIGVAPKTWTEKPRNSAWPETLNYAEALFRRRSRRNFVSEPLSEDHVGALIDSVCSGDLVHSAEGAGYDRALCIGLLAGDHFLERMAHICLDQQWLVNAATHFLFIANLELMDRTWGARGYRYTMLTAGRMGQRLYLTATAMAMGCCGIGAFYDGEAADLLGLNKESRLLYLVAVGPVKSKIGASQIS
jgi:SagB-type dehydrogenase family enzyme